MIGRFTWNSDQRSELPRTRTPDVSGADSTGQYTGDVQFVVSTETCPEMVDLMIDKPVPMNCVGTETIAQDTSYQNIYLRNQSCETTPDGGNPSIVLSEL